MAAPMHSILRRQLSSLSRYVSQYAHGSVRSGSQLASNRHCPERTNTATIATTPLQSLLSCRFHSSVRNCSSPKSSNKAFSSSLAAQRTDQQVSDVVEKINEEVSQDPGRLFAVIQMHGRQRKITVNDLVLMKYHLPADMGEKIRLNKVLMVGSKNFSLIGKPVLDLDQALVEAVVIEKTLSPTQISFLYKKRKSWKRMWLKKFQYTVLRITDIQVSPCNE